MEEEEIIEKVKKFLEEKAGLDKQGCYFVTKKLNEEYWGDVDAEVSDGEEVDDGFDEDLDDEPLAPPEKPKGKVKIKRPQIKIKNQPTVPVQEDF